VDHARAAEVSIVEQWRGKAPRLVLLSICLAFLLPGCAPRQSVKMKQKAAARQPQAEKSALIPTRLRQEHLALSLSDEKGQPLLEATAESVEVDEKSKVGRMSRPRLTFYENGREGLRAQAGSLALDYGKKAVLLEGGVEGRSQASGYSFRADRARWDYGKKELKAWGNVRFWRKEWLAEGTELVGDTALKRARLLGSPARLTIIQKATEKGQARRQR
jgi:lipopolysaccharide assembly outer membrane protein LptD (OstA)